MSDAELRELDSEVYAKVIGLCAHVIPDSPGKYQCSKCGLNGFKCEVVEVPRFASSIAAAQEVVERLTGGSRYVEMSNRDGQWEVIFWDYADSLGSAACKSLPEAICRAALAAVVET